MSNIVAESSRVRSPYVTCEPWCINHHRAAVRRDDFCSTETVDIAGIETHVSNGTLTDRPEIFVTQTAWAPETMTPAAALALAERLRHLASLTA